MESVIAGLLKDFEAGRMNRRQLIQSLAMAAVAAAVPGTVASASQGASPGGQGFKAISVDHISYQVTDYKVTRDFYAGVLGMTVTDDNGTSQCYMHFGDEGAFLLPRNRRGGRAGQPPQAGQPVPGGPPAAGAAPGGQPGQGTGPAPVTSVVDHISFKIQDWNTDGVEAELKRRGLTPRLDAPPSMKNWASFHVKDPDGWDLQISGDCKPGDRLYKGGV